MLTTKTAMRALIILALLPPVAALPADVLSGQAEAVRHQPALSAPDKAGQHWHPFTLTPGNQIRFAMLINGQPASALLDTGASRSVLARHYAQSIGLKVHADGRATAVGGTVAIGRATLGSMALAGVSRRGGGITIADLPAIATGNGAPVDALIGQDIIGEYALDIDFERKALRLLPSGHLPFAGEVAPLAVPPALGVYASTATIGEYLLQPMVVDTGDGASITLSRASWTATKAAPQMHITTAIGFGLGGKLVSELAILPVITIGALAARNVEVRIESEAGFSQSIGAAGRIGTGFLQRYRVLLDPRAGRMVLAATARTADPVLRSTSGVLLGVEPGRLRILHVMRGGPAEQAGWREGELICTVDGAPIQADYASSALADWSVGAPGRAVSLGFCDGAIRRLTLSQFY